MPVTTPVSLSKIRAEFGGPANFSAYVRGGTYVPSSPQNNNILTTRAGLAMSQFAGASKSPPLSGDTSSIRLVMSYPPNVTSFPNSVDVDAYAMSGASGGTGSYTYVWSIRSGPAVIVGSNTVDRVQFRAHLLRWTYANGVIRCVINDGSTSITIDRPYELGYEAGIPI